MTTLITAGELQAFDEEQRLLEVRVLPWDVEVSTERGVEVFRRGAFEGIDPARFILRQRHQDPPTGRGVSLEERDDALYMGARVARTAAGDEQLTLARDGIETGISVGFEDGEVERSSLPNGRTRYEHKRVNPEGVLELSTTYRPAYGEASRILQVLERTDTVTDESNAAAVTEAPAALPARTITDEQLQEFQAQVLDRVEALREQQTAMRLGVVADDRPAHLERRVELRVRELAEVITTGNEGVVPDVLSSEMLGAIATGRPFLNATRQVPAPAAGINLLFPKLTQRPLVAKQAAEKDELASRATIIGTVDFPMQTHGGAGDLSMQLIRRSSPEFLGLWLELLGQAYATSTEDAGLDALLAEAAVVEGGIFDVDSPAFGAAFSNAISATGATMRPDRIFLSTAGLVAFMDAKTPAGGGGTPVYPGLAGIGGLTGGGGSEAGINLTPVWVPALDDEAPDVIIGPSRAFVWAEDGTYTLQADVPAKFGRDVGLAGMVWYAPIYPAAFTSYTLS